MPEPMPRAAVLPGTDTLPKAWGELHKQFLVFLRVECGLSPNTLDAYGRDLASLMHGMGKVSTARGMTARHLTQHLSRLKTERSLAGSSVIRHMASIKVFCRWLKARGALDEDPSEVLERPMRWKRLPGVLSPKQLKALIEAAGQERHEGTKAPRHEGKSRRAARVRP